MSQKRAGPPRPLPGWLVGLASLLIGFHLLAVAVRALAAPSGPWPTPFGSSMDTPPEFAGRINRVTERYYLNPLRMPHAYHFASNQLGLPAIYFEARLKDADGKVVKTLRFPDEGDNFWVRHRQSLLAEGLGNDQPVQPPRGEKIPAPDQKMPTLPIWDIIPERPPTKGQTELRLREVPEHLVPRERPVFRPSPWALILAHAYMRHLCRTHGVPAVELVRHSREAVLPGMMFANDLPPDAFSELICSYGEYRLEK